MTLAPGRDRRGRAWPRPPCRDVSCDSQDTEPPRQTPDRARPCGAHGTGETALTSPWSSPTPRSRRLVASAREAPSGQIVVQVCQGSIRCCVGRLDRGNEGSVVRARCAKGVQRGERSKILRPIRGEIGDGRSRHLRRVGVGGSEFRALLTDFWHIGFGQSGDFAVHTPKRELERRRATVERQIAELRAGLDAEESETEMLSSQEAAREEALLADRRAMAAKRGAAA